MEYSITTCCLTLFLSSANHPDNCLTIAKQSTTCLSGYYDEKPDNLTVFEKFLFLLKISVYVHLLLISVTANQYYFYPPIIFPPAMSPFGTYNLYLCRRDPKQNHHDNKTHITQDTHNSDKTPLPLYHDSNHKRMLLRNRT